MSFPNEQDFERIHVHSIHGRLVQLRAPILNTKLGRCNGSTSAKDVSGTEEDDGYQICSAILQWKHYIPGDKRYKLLRSSEQSKEPVNIAERKRKLIYDAPGRVWEAMEKCVEIEMAKLDPARSGEECWLHPEPERHGMVGQKFLSWKDDFGNSVELRVHLGLLLLLLADAEEPDAGHLTQAQKEGYINDAWELSHLCGNWTCVNYLHLNMEDHKTNMARNQCFKTEDICKHDPPCLKHLKKPLHTIGRFLLTAEEMDAVFARPIQNPDSSDDDEYSVPIQEGTPVMSDESDEGDESSDDSQSSVARDLDSTV